MLVSFRKNSDGVRVYENKKNVKQVLAWANANIEHAIIYPHDRWNKNIEYIQVYSTQDCLALLLKFGHIIEKASWSEIRPDDNDEVKIHCHRCNGCVFSVSGYEWKTERSLRSYTCKLKEDGKCAYD